MISNEPKDYKIEEIEMQASGRFFNYTNRKCYCTFTLTKQELERMENKFILLASNKNLCFQSDVFTIIIEPWFLLKMFSNNYISLQSNLCFKWKTNINQPYLNSNNTKFRNLLMKNTSDKQRKIRLFDQTMINIINSFCVEAFEEICNTALGTVNFVYAIDIVKFFFANPNKKYIEISQEEYEKKCKIHDVIKSGTEIPIKQLQKLVTFEIPKNHIETLRNALANPNNKQEYQKIVNFNICVPNKSIAYVQLQQEIISEFPLKNIYQNPEMDEEISKAIESQIYKIFFRKGDEKQLSRIMTEYKKEFLEMEKIFKDIIQLPNID